MPKMTTFINALRFLGPVKMLRTVSYAIERDRVERKSIARQPENQKISISPGNWKSYQTTDYGVVIEFNECRLEINALASNIYRLTWLPGILPIPYAIEQKQWDRCSWNVKEQPFGLKISTQKSCLYIKNDGSLDLLDAHGHYLRSEQPPLFTRPGWAHIAELHSSECIYGLGLRSHRLNLRGGKFRMWNTDPGGTYNLGDDPLYLCIPAYIGMNTNGLYMVFYENTQDGEISFIDHAIAKFQGGALRYYLLIGSTEEILQGFSQLTGKPPLPPRWALGYHQSRWGYKTAEEVKALADDFHKYDIPLAAIHLDIDYMQGYRVFTNDPKRFPDLANLSHELIQQGIRLVAIIDPGVKSDPKYRVFTEGVNRNCFVTGPDQNIIEGLVWPGRCAFPDFTSTKVRDWWGNQYQQLLEQGISGFWHDMNEPSIFAAWGDTSLPRNAYHDLDGQVGDHQTAHNVYGMLMNRAGCEGLHKHDPEHRPWILSRSGWAGNQRYAWNWSADVNSTWEMLSVAISSLINLSLSGIYYAGTDIGGFSKHPTKELYIRWFQLGSFSPCFRLHNSTGLPPREPWHFDEETLEIIRELIKFRQKLIPYWYTMAYEAAESGKPLMRPMFWEEPHNPEFWEIDDQFMLGPHLLVAPVIRPGVDSRIVILPKGGWYEFGSGKYHPGSQQIIAQAPISKIPIYIRAGSIIPLEINNEPLLNVYLPQNTENEPTRHEYNSLWYSDAGDGYGSYRLDSFKLSSKKSKITIKHVSDGEYSLGKPIGVKFVGRKIDRVWVDGIETKFPENHLHLAAFEELVLQLT